MLTRPKPRKPVTESVSDSVLLNTLLRSLSVLSDLCTGLLLFVRELDRFNSKLFGNVL